VLCHLPPSSSNGLMTPKWSGFRVSQLSEIGVPQLSGNPNRPPTGVASNRNSSGKNGRGHALKIGGREQP
jgi:hypothetical protein